MNAESFANLLKEYAQLYQLPMEELRTMVMQYPYCHNLQVLLQEKAELDQHPDREKTLAKAATYAIDRKHLFKRLRLMREKRVAAPAEAYHLGEDFLELKDLSAVQSDLEKIALGVYQDPSSSQTMAIEPEPPSLTAPDVKPEPSINTWEGYGEAIDADPFEAFGESSLEFNPTPEIKRQETSVHSNPLEDITSSGQEEASPVANAPLPDLAPHSITPIPVAPTPKKAFNSWSTPTPGSHLQVSVNHLLEEEQLERKKNKHLGGVDSTNEVTKKAWQSMVDSDSMASETWANLLVAQKQYHKAIEVYERLMLLIPEKNTFFAAQIELIKKSLS